MFLVAGRIRREVVEKCTIFDHMQQKCYGHLHILTSSLFSLSN